MISTDESFRVLLRVTLELFQRAGRIRDYLRSIGPGGSREYEEINSGVEFAITRIETEVLEALTDLAPLNADSDPQKVVVLFDVLKRFADWFVKIHELLIYLPRQDALFETFYTLESCFKDHFKESKPSILLGSVFNAFEFDFWQEMRKKMPDLDEIGLSDSNVVLELAICDKNSPMAWGALAHELGHAIDQKNHISERVAAKFVSQQSSLEHAVVNNWAGELAADLIAAAVFGPSSITSLTSVTYCLFTKAPLFNPIETHPPTHHRLHVVSEYLRTKYNGWDALADERKDLRSAVELSMGLFAKSEREVGEFQAKDDDWGDFSRRLSDDLLAEIETSVSLPDHTLDPQSVERCVNRLEDRSPVSAQGLDRKELQEKLDAYRGKTFENNSQRTQAFRDLARLFREEPLEIQVILWSGRMRCDHIASTRIDRCLSSDEGVDELVGELRGVGEDRKPRLVEEFQNLDYLIVSSINTSSVHTSPTLARHEDET